LRIQKNQELFAAKYSEKKLAEDDYYNARYAIRGRRRGMVKGIGEGGRKGGGRERCVLGVLEVYLTDDSSSTKSSKQQQREKQRQ